MPKKAQPTCSMSDKPYPCGIVIHPTLDACLQLVHTSTPDPAHIARVRLQVHPLCLTLCDRPAPTGQQEAQVSLQHWTAAALLHRAAGIAQGTDACVRDPQVIALRQRVEATADESVGRDGAIVKLDFHDGTVLEQRVEHCIGSLDRPMTDNELAGKFLEQAAEVLPAAQARHLMALCWRLQELDNVADIATNAF